MCGLAWAQTLLTLEGPVFPMLLTPGCSGSDPADPRQPVFRRFLVFSRT